MILYEQLKYQTDKNRFPGKAFLIVGGGDGNYSITKAVADYFARAGLTTLAVAYWNKPGLSYTVSKIPLETIEKPVKLLRKLGAQKVGMWGISKGAEYALLCGSYLPELISAVVAVSPASHVIQGFQTTNSHHLFPKPIETSPFTYQGIPLPYVKTQDCVKRCLIESVKRRSIYFRSGYEHIYDEPAKNTIIPVEQCSGPVLLLAAEQDDMWDSCRACENILENLKDKEFPYLVLYEHYPFGSHMLFPVRTVFSKFFKIEREYGKEYKQSCLDSFEKTMEFIKNW